jgi:hypothetical protein
MIPQSFARDLRKIFILLGRISNLLPITLSFGEGWVRQKKCVNLKCALLLDNGRNDKTPEKGAKNQYLLITY